MDEPADDRPDSLPADAARAALDALASTMAPQPTGRSRSYRRFVLLAHQRSGSTWIVGTLQAHPHAVCFSEAFNPGEAQLYVPGVPPTSTELRDLREVVPQAFLDRIVFTGFADEIDAVGFKLMASHLDQPGSRPALMALLDDPAVTVLRISRRNKLAAALSLYHAQRSDVWHLSPGSTEPESPVVRLPAGFCRRVITDFEAEDERLDRLLAGREHHRVVYEDLLASPQAQFQALEDILGLVPHDGSPPSRRQQTRPLREAIANFDALAERFTGTPWERYFVDRDSAR